MTDRCEPPEALRDVSGWHWVQYRRSPPFVAAWCAHEDGGNWDRSEMWGGKGFRYLCPVPPPGIISDLITALDRIAHMHRAEALIAIAALHKYDPSRRVLNESPLPVIDETIKPPAQYYPERQS